MPRLSNHRICSQPCSLNGFRIEELDWKAFTLDPEDPARLLQRERHSPLVRKCEQLLGSFAGRSVLELGPHEGSTTVAVHQSYADDIVAVEPKWFNYLKCLIVKEHFRLGNARFFLGDPLKYLESCQFRFDVIIATGFLFRCHDPCRVLELMTGVADTIAINTNVFDSSDRIHGFTGQQRMVQSARKNEYCLYERQSGSSGHSQDADVDVQPGRSAWVLSKDDLVAFLEEMNYKIDVFVNVQSDGTGRRIALTAQRLS